MTKTTFFIFCLLIMEGRSITQDELEEFKREFFEELEVKLGNSPIINAIEQRLNNFQVKLEEITPALQVEAPLYLDGGLAWTLLIAGLKTILFKLLHTYYAYVNFKEYLQSCCMEIKTNIHTSVVLLYEQHMFHFCQYNKIESDKIR